MLVQKFTKVSTSYHCLKGFCSQYPILPIILGDLNFRKHFPGWPNTAGVGYSNIQAGSKLKIYVLSSKDSQSGFR